jgi:Uma2 family endonuclease
MSTSAPLAVVNPVLLAEVTSPSTEDYDRGQKLRHYQGLASVREVLVVSHREPWVSVHRREQAGWSTHQARRGEAFELACVELRIEVDDLYQDGLEDAP